MGLEQRIHTFFPVGYPVTEPVRRAIRALPEHVWHPALEQDGSLWASAQVAELTGMVDPNGTRIIVRRERPHPGAQLSLFDLDEGMRHQVLLTDTPYGEGSLQHLEVRHRAHARVEDCIRCGKTTGFGRFPSRHFASDLGEFWSLLRMCQIGPVRPIMNVRLAYCLGRVLSQWRGRGLLSGPIRKWIYPERLGRGWHGARCSAGAGLGGGCARLRGPV